jgi:hypothetical protein
LKPRKERPMSKTTFGGTAEHLSLEGEENGWELVVETLDGTFRFNVHGIASSGDLDDQIRGIGSALITWKAEGKRAALEHSIDMAKRQTDEDHDRMVGDA